MNKDDIYTRIFHRPVDFTEATAPNITQLFYARFLFMWSSQRTCT